LFDIGVVSGSDITPEAALTKLSYILGYRDMPLEEKKRVRD
jgi:lysophospholipase